MNRSQNIYILSALLAVWLCLTACGGAGGGGADSGGSDATSTIMDAGTPGTSDGLTPGNVIANPYPGIPGLTAYAFTLPADGASVTPDYSILSASRSDCEWYMPDAEVTVDNFHTAFGTTGHLPPPYNPNAAALSCPEGDVDLDFKDKPLDHDPTEFVATFISPTVLDVGPTMREGLGRGETYFVEIRDSELSAVPVYHIYEPDADGHVLIHYPLNQPGFRVHVLHQLNTDALVQSDAQIVDPSASGHPPTGDGKDGSTTGGATGGKPTTPTGH